MALVFARKVNQQHLYIEQMLGLIQQTAGAGQASLVQAGYLQLELGLRWYLLELAAVNNADDSVLEFVSLESVAELNAAAPCLELTEILDLLKRPESWLTGFLSQLQTLRSGEPPAKLRGSIFQTDEQQNQNVAESQIALKEVSAAPEQANAADLNRAADDFKCLVERQRAVRAEY